MAKNYLVLANLAGYDKNEEELYTHFWTVGTFDTLEECYEACKKDIEQVATDAFEPSYGEDEVEELNEAVREYTDCAVEVQRADTELLFFERSLIYYLEYGNDDWMNNLDYFVIKI
jgi:hypothetical protein